MTEEPVSEFVASDKTVYRFGRDDLVLQLVDEVAVGTYRWKRAFDFAIDEYVQVEFGGTAYEYVEDEDNEVALIRGAVPHGITAGCHLTWYEETDAYSDLALVLDPDGAVIGGFVEEVQDDDEDEDDAGPAFAASAGTMPSSATGLATESAGRPLVPLLLVLVAVAGLIVFLAVG